MKKILFMRHPSAFRLSRQGAWQMLSGSLPKCFDKEYFDVRVMMPKYMCMKEECEIK